MTRRAGALTVLLLLAPVAARADVQSYAYVTDVEPDWDAPGGGEYCDLTAILPAAQLAAAPHAVPNATQPGATQVTEHVSDPFRRCYVFLDTWQRVRFNPAHRARARFLISQPLRYVIERVMDFVNLGLVVVLALLLVVGWIVKRRARRAAA